MDTDCDRDAWIEFLNEQGVDHLNRGSYIEVHDEAGNEVFDIDFFDDGSFKGFDA